MVNIDPVKDLAALVAPPTPFQGMRFSQGTIKSWDPETFENQIEWRGITLTNIPVLSGPDALTYQAGDVLALLGWNPTGGMGSWWILGRVIVPGPGAGAAAIDFLTASLGAAIARAVIAEVIQVDTVIETGTTNIENQFVDLEFAGNPNPGPSVDIEVGPAGRAVVFVGAQIGVIEFGSGLMSFAGTGPETITAETITGAFTSVNLPTGDDVRVGSMGLRLLTGLTPGIYTLTAKYRVSNQSFGGGISFANRTLLAIPF